MLICLFVGVSGLVAQTNSAALLKRGLKEHVESKKPMTKSEKLELTRIVNERLKKAIHLGEDRKATALYRIHPSATPYRVEWKEFRIKRISRMPISQADRLNGINQRYAVFFDALAHRYWDSRTSNWTNWRNGGYPLFPKSLVVERVGERLQMKRNTQLDLFYPVQLGFKPKDGTTDAEQLPPGVTRILR